MLSSGPKLSKLLLILFLLGLAIIILRTLLVGAVSIYNDPSTIDLFGILIIGGMLTFSLSLVYIAFMQMVPNKVMTRKGFALLWLSVSWGLFSFTVKLYPWNIIFALGFLLIGLPYYYRYPWKLVDGKWVDKVGKTSVDTDPVELNKTVSGLQKTLLFVWVVFVSTLLLYLLIPNLVSISEVAIDRLSSAAKTIRMTLWAVNLLAVGAIYWWKIRFLNKQTLSGLVNVQGKIFIRTIIALGLAEYIAVNGFLLGLLLGHIWDQYLFTLISGFFFYSLYPSKPFFEDLARKPVADTV